MGLSSTSTTMGPKLSLKTSPIAHIVKIGRRKLDDRSALLDYVTENDPKMSDESDIIDKRELQEIEESRRSSSNYYSILRYFAGSSCIKMGKMRKINYFFNYQSSLSESSSFRLLPPCLNFENITSCTLGRGSEVTVVLIAPVLPKINSNSSEVIFIPLKC